MFDISQIKNFYREVFRGKLKELNFYPLQKSVWICPFKCKDEINLLKDFLGLTDEEVRFITTDDIGKENKLRKIFKI
jgi:DNA-binding transcriptional regulator PaaX